MTTVSQQPPETIKTALERGVEKLTAQRHEAHLERTRQREQAIAAYNARIAQARAEVVSAFPLFEPYLHLGEVYTCPTLGTKRLPGGRLIVIKGGPVRNPLKSMTFEVKAPFGLLWAEWRLGVAITLDYPDYEIFCSADGQYCVIPVPTKTQADCEVCLALASEAETKRQHLELEAQALNLRLSTMSEAERALDSFGILSIMRGEAAL